jgi:DNA-binding NarL/FixJ family response regulator
MRILLADDHPVVRIAIKNIISNAFAFAEIFEVDNGTDLEKYALRKKLDLIITDISMPGTEVTAAIKAIKSISPKLPIIVLSMNAAENYAVSLFKIGISAYLPKENASNELLNAIEVVMKGKKYITPDIAEILASSFSSNNHAGEQNPKQLLTFREFEIFKLIASGLGISEIEHKLSIKRSTISSTKAKIIKKINVHNSNDLIRYAITNHIIS